MDELVVLKDVKAYVKKHPLLNKTQKKIQISTTSEGDVVYLDKKPKIFTTSIDTLAYSFREAIK